MSNLPPQGWRSSWSNPQPAPWLTGLAPPDIAMSELRPQGSSYSGNMGEVSESMAVDRLEEYSEMLEAEMNDMYGCDVGMELDLPTFPSDPMDVDVATEASYLQATAAGPSSGYYHSEEPRTPRRRPLGRAVTTFYDNGEPSSPTPSLIRTRSYAVLTAVTNTPKRNPTIPYTPQRTDRKPSAPHPILEPRQHDGSPYCPPTTPRRKRRVDSEIHPLFAALTEHEIEVLTERLARLRISSGSGDEMNWETLSDAASYLSAAGSDATTVVPLLERLAFKDLDEDDDFDTALDYLRDVMKDIQEY